MARSRIRAMGSSLRLKQYGSGYKVGSVVCAGGTWGVMC